MSGWRASRAIAILLIGIAAVEASRRTADAHLPGGRVLLHAHNCYPDLGRWTDRLDRALGTGLRPIAIEQDVIWDAARSRSVVSHGAPVTGSEPSLEDHFFGRLRPIVEAALAANRPDTWPIVILHLDFKSNEPEHHRAIRDLLGRYESWFTWAPRVADPAAVQPLTPGPVMALTEQGEGQERTFHDEIPVGGRIRIFGTVPPVPRPSTGDRDADLRAAAAAAVIDLIPSVATNYRRWTNHSWAVIEEGGQPRGGAWTPEEASRLDAVVGRAHKMGLWIRFYTLNGHSAEQDRGWTASYNFGSLEAVRPRWRAAIDAGVDFVATDQYEEFAAELIARTRR